MGGAGSDDTLLLSITINDAVNHKQDILDDLQAARTNQPLSKFFKFSVSDFENFHLTLALSSQTVGQFDNIVLGTSNHDNGSSAPALNGTAQNDLILGLGGNDVIHGGDGDDVIIGGIGNDALFGDAGDDVFVFLPTDTGYDAIDGGADDDTVIADGSAVIALAGYSDTVETFKGTGSTYVQGNPSSHNTLNFTNTEFDGIKEIGGGGVTSNDVFYISTKSDATYRGEEGNDTFHLKGSKLATFVYTGIANGFDSFIDDGYGGTAIAKAQDSLADPVTVIGVHNYTNQLSEFQGTGDTKIVSDGDHNALDFSSTPLTGIASVESGAGNDVVTTSLTDRVATLTYDGGSYTGDKLYLAVTLEEAIANATAIKADFTIAQTNPTSATALSNFFKFKIQNFESVKLAVYNDGQLLGLIDNIILGTANHDSGSPYAPVLNGTAQNDLIVGLGGDDVIHGLGGNDIIAGGGVSSNGGNDKLYGDGGDDVFVFLPTDNGYYDFIDGGTGNDTVIALGGAVIGLTHHYNTVEKFVGTGNTVIKGSPSVHSTLDFTNSEFDGIKEVEGGGSTANNVISISTVSDATYRGSGNNETFNLQGSKNATFVYSGAGAGFDNFVKLGGYTGTAIAKAVSANTVIGIGNYANQLAEIQGTGDTVIRASDSVHNALDFSSTPLPGIASVESGAGNDAVTTSLSDRVSTLTYDGGSYTGDKLYLAVTLEEAIANATAIKADFDAAKATPGGATLSNFFEFTIQNFESVKLAVYHNGQLLGLIDNIKLGTSNHDSGSPYAPVLNGTAQNDLIIGLGGNDVIHGLGGNDIIVGGGVASNSGADQLYGDAGDDVFVYPSTDDLFYDTIDGGTGNDTVIALGNAVIGLTNHNNSNMVEKFVGTGTTVIQGSPAVHSTLDFTNSEFVGIKEIEGGGSTADNIIYISKVSDATYRANGNNETFYLQGTKNATFVYSGAGAGFDTFVKLGGYTGTAIAKAVSANTVIGIGNYANQLSEFQSFGVNTIIRASDGTHNILNFATTTLTNIAEVDSGGGDDVITVSNLSATSYRGGLGNDKFIIADGASLPEVVILDFKNGADKIGVAGSLVGIVWAQDSVVLADTIVTLPSGRKVRLKNFTAANLLASDFVLAP